MDFPKFCMDLETHFFGRRCTTQGATTSSTGGLELRLGKNPSRSFRPVKSAEMFWQFLGSCSFRVSLAHDVGAMHLTTDMDAHVMLSKFSRSYELIT
ncbi:hypothetical protein Tco_0888119, partial [Tanacetum coccineum]